MPVPAPLAAWACVCAWVRLQPLLVHGAVLAHGALGLPLLLLHLLLAALLAAALLATALLTALLATALLALRECGSGGEHECRGRQCGDDSLASHDCSSVWTFNRMNVRAGLRLTPEPLALLKAAAPRAAA